MILLKFMLLKAETISDLLQSLAATHPKYDVIFTANEKGFHPPECCAFGSL
jgi:hypothetical protein